MKRGVIKQYNVILTVKRMENEVVCYVTLGAYIKKLQKHANLRNEDICKGVNIGHTTLNLLKKGQNAR